MPSGPDPTLPSCRYSMSSSRLANDRRRDTGLSRTAGRANTHPQSWALATPAETAAAREDRSCMHCEPSFLSRYTGSGSYRHDLDCGGMQSTMEPTPDVASCFQSGHRPRAFALKRQTRTRTRRPIDMLHFSEGKGALDVVARVVMFEEPLADLCCQGPWRCRSGSAINLPSPKAKAIYDLL
jgi:hypothetical protein